MYGRLDTIRTNSLIPPSAGAEDAHNHLWIGAFGNWARQKADGLDSGYKYNSWGMSIGYDRAVASVDGLLFRVSLTFAEAKIKTDHDLASVDIRTFGASVYGSYTFNNFFFVDATAAFARSASSYNINIVTGGDKTGKYDTDTTQLGFRVGGIFTAGPVRIIPTVGVRWSHYYQKWFTEEAHNTLLWPNVFDKASDSSVEIPIMVKFTGTFDAGSVRVSPELKLGWTAMVDRPDNRFSVGFAGSPYRAQISGAQPPKNSFQAGAGLKIETSGGLEFFVESDGDFARKFSNHRFSAGFGGYF